MKPVVLRRSVHYAVFSCSDVVTQVFAYLYGTFSYSGSTLLRLRNLPPSGTCSSTSLMAPRQQSYAHEVERYASETCRPYSLARALCDNDIPTLQIADVDSRHHCPRAEARPRIVRVALRSRQIGKPSNWGRTHLVRHANSPRQVHVFRKFHWGTVSAFLSPRRNTHNCEHRPFSLRPRKRCSPLHVEDPT